MKMIKVVTSVLILGASMVAYGEQYQPIETLAQLDVSFADSTWNGKVVPKGQHCKMFEGNGATPLLSVGNIPKGSNAILVSYNDKTFKPNDNGGHGIIGIWVEEGKTVVEIPSVAGESNELPKGMFIEQKFRSNRGKGGAYLPPCSGGRGNEYNATIQAVYKSSKTSEKSALLGEGVIALGKY